MKITNKYKICVICLFILAIGCKPTEDPIVGESMQIVTKVDIQPLQGHLERLINKMAFLGSPFSQSSVKELEMAFDLPNDSLIVRRLQDILDKNVLVNVHINPESRVKVTQGLKGPKLLEKETQNFLIKIHNEAGVTSRLALDYDDKPDHNRITHAQDQMSVEKDPLFHVQFHMPGPSWNWGSEKYPLTGLELNYGIISIYCKDAGKRELNLSFDVGQGTQDLGFRSELPILFESLPTYELVLEGVRDEHNEPVMARFLVRDNNGKVFPSQSQRIAPDF